MTTLSTALATPTLSRPLGRTVTIYLKEAKYEFLKSLRLRAYSFSTIGFPLMFYILFGLVMGKQSIGDVNLTKYLLATYGTFGIMGASLYGTAGALAAERGLGWLQVKRASPMPPFAYFTAKVVKSMIFSAVVVLLLFFLGFTFGGVSMPAPDAVRLFAILVAGSLPFCAMGLALGYFLGPNSAPAILNMIYFPLSFCSGLWIPFIFLPRLMREIALFLPPYHLAQLALSVFGAGQPESAWSHWGALIGFSLICLGVARFGLHRDSGKTYG